MVKNYFDLKLLKISHPNQVLSHKRKIEPLNEFYFILKLTKLAWLDVNKK